MSELSVATTINPRFDHVTPIEATQSSVTITHRCQVFAELMAVARSGLVDIVLIADDLELVGLETLHQVLDGDGQGPKVAVISDVVEDRHRLADLGIPVASPTLTGSQLVEWLRHAYQEASAASTQQVEFSAHDLQVLEQLDPDTQTKRQTGRRAASYDPPNDFTDQREPGALTQRPPQRHDELSMILAPSSGTADLDTSPDPTIGTEGSSSVESNEVPRGQLTAVWGPIGAPGATTVAVNLAAESALDGYRTLLIDANTYGAAVAVQLGLLDDAAAIAQACRAIEHRGISAVELGDYAQHVRLDGASLDVITGLTRSERWPQLRAAAWDQLLETARDGWDHIIVDCGFGLEEDEELSFDIPAPQRNATTISALRAANTVVAVGTGDPVGFVRLMKGLEQLIEITTKSVIPVVNKVTAMTSGTAPKRQLADVWERFGPKIELHHFIPWAPEVTAAALLEGKTLAERAPKAEVRVAIRHLLHAFAPVERPRTVARKPTGHTRLLWSFRKMMKGTQVQARDSS